MINDIEKNIIIESFELGDIIGLEEIKKILEKKCNGEKDIDTEIFDLLEFVTTLNYYVAIGETQKGLFADNYIDIHELYLKMLNVLFDKLEIKV